MISLFLKPLLPTVSQQSRGSRKLLKLFRLAIGQRAVALETSVRVYVGCSERAVSKTHRSRGASCMCQRTRTRFEAFFLLVSVRPSVCPCGGRMMGMFRLLLLGSITWRCTAIETGETPRSNPPARVSALFFFFKQQNNDTKKLK